MPLVPVAPPMSVPVFSGFDYVTVDAGHRRVIAAHGGSRALLIVDADSGAVVGQVRVGPVRGVAFDPQSGHVFTANGDDRTVSEVDPVTLKVVRSVDLGASLDAMVYDAAKNRLYVDEDNGTKLFVIDAATMKQVGVVDLPGSKPEYLAVDPQSHDVYQNIDDLAQVAVVDSTTLKVKRTFSTPELAHNHPLQYDPALQQIVTGGNGMLSAYSRDGKKLGSLATQRYDQCDLDTQSHLMACAGGKKIQVVRLQRGGAPTMVTEIDVPAGVHTLAIDSKTKNVWIVWASPQGDFVQRYSLTP